MAISEALRRAAPRPVSARRLAEDFGVTRRTIERDLVALREAGLPLYAERGRNGGAVSVDQMANVLVTLTPNQVLALLTAVTAAGEAMPFADAGASAVNRILDALPDTTRVATEELRSRVRSREEPLSALTRRVRRTLETAVQRQVVVNLRYRDRHETVTRRSVDAVGFLRHTEGWYLIGWCHEREAGRLFRLDRVEAANLTRRPAASHDVDETLGWVPDTVARP